MWNRPAGKEQRLKALRAHIFVAVTLIQSLLLSIRQIFSRKSGFDFLKERWLMTSSCKIHHLSVRIFTKYSKGAYRSRKLAGDVTGHIESLRLSCFLYLSRRSPVHTSLNEPLSHFDFAA